MELRHLKYFQTIAKEGSFTKAAEKLSMSQPPLSRQIKDLENELGVTLFKRKYDHLELTKEGELFLDYANRIIELTMTAIHEVRHVK